MLDALRAALGLGLAPVEAPPGGTLYAPEIFGPVVRRPAPAQWNPSLSSVVVLGAHPKRAMASFFNGSTSNVFLGLGSSVSLTDYTVQLVPGAFYELAAPAYTGDVSAIWDALSGGSLLVSEQVDV